MSMLRILGGPECRSARVALAFADRGRVAIPICIRAAGLVTLLGAASPALALAAFPGAEGFGADTPGGRGGRVLAVTSLADSGPGTLREALATPGPRIVVFRVAGFITLESPLLVAEPFVTLAGQTAPGTGVLIRHKTAAPFGLASDSFQSLQIATHDVVIRYLMIRPGIWPENPACTGKNAIPHPEGWGTCVDANDVRAVHLLPGSHRVVLDHLTLAWATDEAIAVQGATDVTLQWSIVTSGFTSFPYCGNWVACPSYRGMGLIAGDHASAASGHETTRLTIHHNLWAHLAARTPQLVGVADVRENVIYDWREHGANAHNMLGATAANYVGNLSIPGPESKHPDNGLTANDWADHARYVVTPNAPLRFHLDGNVGEPMGCSRWSTPTDAWEPCVLANHLLPSPVEAPLVERAADVLTDVLEGAGAGTWLDATGNLKRRWETFDLRLRIEVKTRSGRAPSHTDALAWPKVWNRQPYADNDGDGMPDEWERIFGFEPLLPDDGNMDLDGDGYTNVEEFLNATEP